MHVKEIVFTNVQLLHRFINERGMIISRRQSYNCKKHQKLLAKAIRRARVIGFLNPINNFYAPESFTTTNLGDLAKLSQASLDLYGIKLPTAEELEAITKRRQASDEQGHAPSKDWKIIGPDDDIIDITTPPRAM